jgi:hypothetical protein
MHVQSEGHQRHPHEQSATTPFHLAEVSSRAPWKKHLEIQPSTSSRTRFPDLLIKAISPIHLVQNNIFPPEWENRLPS